MSFILDALKKSEEERRRGEVPDLRAQHAAFPQPRPRRLLWPALFSAALLVNAPLLLWWQPWQPNAQLPPPSPLVAPPPAPPADSVAPPAPAPVLPTAEEGEPPRVYLPQEPAGWSDLRLDPPPRPKSPAAAAAVPRRPSRPAPFLPHLRDLPEARRQFLPDLKISMHYYNPDPGSRMVRMNGRILREGSILVEGLTVEEITSAGVILNWQGERFRAGDY